MASYGSYRLFDHEVFQREDFCNDTTLAIPIGSSVGGFSFVGDCRCVRGDGGRPTSEAGAIIVQYELDGRLRHAHEPRLTRIAVKQNSQGKIVYAIDFARFA